MFSHEPFRHGVRFAIKWVTAFRPQMKTKEKEIYIYIYMLAINLVFDITHAGGLGKQSEQQAVLIRGTAPPNDNKKSVGVHLHDYSASR